MDRLRLRLISNFTLFSLEQPPEARYTFGKIRGYYVGYKELHSSAPYIYKTITVDGHPASSSSDLLKSGSVSSNGGVWQPNQFKAETIIKGLRRNTKYEIIIQPFNTKGRFYGAQSAQRQPNDNHISLILTISKGAALYRRN